MDLVSVVFGIYPKSDELRRAIGKWEKGVLKGKEIAEKIEEESRLFYDLTKSAQLDYFTDPLFNWYDIFRPLVLSVDGMRLGPLTRYKETNTFYRMPIIDKIGKLGEIMEFRDMNENPPLPLYHINDSDSYLPFLPGINSLIMMSNVSRDLENPAEMIKEIYLEILRKLKANRVLIYEPMETENFSIYDDIIQNVKLFLVTTGKVNSSALSANRNRFYSIISDDPYSVSKYCEIPGLKTVNAMNTKIEDDLLERLKGYSNDFDRMIISNNESFDFLPRRVADKKILTFRGGVS